MANVCMLCGLLQPGMHLAAARGKQSKAASYWRQTIKGSVGFQSRPSGGAPCCRCFRPGAEGPRGEQAAAGAAAMDQQAQQQAQRTLDATQPRMVRMSSPGNWNSMPAQDKRERERGARVTRGKGLCTAVPPPPWGGECQQVLLAPVPKKVHRPAQQAVHTASTACRPSGCACCFLLCQPAGRLLKHGPPPQHPNSLQALHHHAPDSRPPDRPFFSTPMAKAIWVEVGPGMHCPNISSSVNTRWVVQCSFSTKSCKGERGGRGAVHG